MALINFLLLSRVYLSIPLRMQLCILSNFILNCQDIISFQILVQKHSKYIVMLNAHFMITAMIRYFSRDFATFVQSVVSWNKICYCYLECILLHIGLLHKLFWFFIEVHTNLGLKHNLYKFFKKTICAIVTKLYQFLLYQNCHSAIFHFSKTFSNHCLQTEKRSRLLILWIDELGDTFFIYWITDLPNHFFEKFK